MTHKTITIGLVALAFVAGSIMTGTIAFADEDGYSGDLLGLIMELETQIISIQTEILQLELHEGPQGPAGPPGTNGMNGADGAKGDKGDVGPSGSSYVAFNSRSVSVDASGAFGAFISVKCNTGDIATGGGGFISNGLKAWPLVESRPTVDIGTDFPTSGQEANGWFVQGSGLNTGEVTGDIKVWAICTSLS